MKQINDKLFFRPEIIKLQYGLTKQQISKPQPIAFFANCDRDRGLRTLGRFRAHINVAITRALAVKSLTLLVHGASCLIGSRVTGQKWAFSPLRS